MKRTFRELNTWNLIKNGTEYRTMGFAFSTLMEVELQNPSGATEFGRSISALCLEEIEK